MLRKFKRLAVLAAGSLAFVTAQAAVTPFQTDVGTAITNGLNYLDTNSVFNNPSNAGNAAGLTTLALLEKRASGNPGDPPQGYNGASSADQARLRRSVAYLLSSGYAAPGPFYAYVDGGFLSALTLYALTGGPDSCGPAPNPRTPCSAYPSTPAELQGLPHSLIDAINNMVDNTLVNQRTVANGYPNDSNVGYWCYTNGGCTDSSTTQYAALGLSAAQAVYNNPTFGDPGHRLPKIATALAAAANVYATDAAQGSQDLGCDPGYKTTPHGGVNGVPGDVNAYGHGYHSPSENYPPSLQQTASGAFVQLLGGGNVNSPMVQGYMRWIYDHYRYTDIGGTNGAGNLYNSWPYSYFYYLWSSFKGMEFIAQQGIAPNAGNLGITSYGTLAAASAPACTDRQLHRDPATVNRVPIFGAGGAGFYSAETKTQYFDYAYSILSYQCANGSFFCNADPLAGGATNGSGAGWGTWDTQAYGLLVLQRATGVVLPTASLATDLVTTTVGTTVHLTWGSQNANSCAATGGTIGDGWTGNALAANGMLPVKEAVAGTYTYTITCSAGNQSAQAQVKVTFTKAAILMCDVSGPNKVPDGEVSQYDINAIMGMLGQKVQPAGPAPAAADPMGGGIITVQDARACVLRCTKAGCAN